MYVHKSQENNRVNDTISYKGKLLQLVRSKRSVHMLYAINITYKYCSAEKGHCFTEEKTSVRHVILLPTLKDFQVRTVDF